MARIEYINDVTGSLQEARGSDSRLNTSSRSDARSYYNSRDQEQAYTMPFDASLASTLVIAYWKNTSTTNDLVISSIDVHPDAIAEVQLYFVTGTAADGTSVTPTNLNKSSSKDAASTSLESNAATEISGLTKDGLIDMLRVGAQEHGDFNLGDRVRLGQNDAIALYFGSTTTNVETKIAGAIYGYFE